MTNNTYAKNNGDGLLCSILWLRSDLPKNLSQHRWPNVMVACQCAGCGADEALYSCIIVVVQLYNALPAHRQATITLGCLWSQANIIG